MTVRKTFRELHAEQLPLIMPGAHDALSARLITLAGFRAFAAAGSALLACRYGLPDLGIVGLGEMLAANQDLVAATHLPCLVDADDGYGDLKSVARTVQSNEAMGAGAIVLEDQSRLVKQPGQGAASAVVSDEEISAKLRVALQTRDSSDLWVFGRTDAYPTLGIEGALQRADLYARTGVDGIFVAGVRTEEDLARVGRTFRGMPLTVVIYGGEGWPSPRVDDLAAMGFTQIVYPQALLLPICALVSDTLAELKRATDSGGQRSRWGDEPRAQEILQDAVELKRWAALGGGPSV